MLIEMKFYAQGKSFFFFSDILHFVIVFLKNKY